MLTRKSLELLIDLVEIKLGSMEVFDRDDQKILRDLEACRKELAGFTRRNGQSQPAMAETALAA